MVIPHAGHITFVLEVEGYEVLHEIRTTRQIEIRIVRHGGSFEHFVLPVHVRIALCLTVVTKIAAAGIILRLHGVILITEIVDEGLRTIECPGSIATQGKFMLDSLIA